MENLANAMAAIGQLGRAFSGSPERVNVIWITSGFLSLAPLINGFEVQSTLDQILHQASNLFLSARIVLYTVDPHGVQSESNLPNHNSQGQGRQTSAQAFANNDGSQFAEQQLNLTANQAVANSFLGAIDQRSGGRAFSNGNDIDLALARIVGESNSSLRVVYSPTDKNFDGGYRKITVKLTRPAFPLAPATATTPSPSRRSPPSKSSGTASPPPSTAPSSTVLSTSPAPSPPHPRRPQPASTSASPRHKFTGSIPPPTPTPTSSSPSPPFRATTAPSPPSPTTSPPAKTTTAGGRPIQYHLRFTPPPGTVRLRVAVSDKHLDQIGTAEIPVVNLPPSIPASTAPAVPPLQQRPTAQPSTSAAPTL